ncbi:MAG TPA: S8 family serine peptidase [Pyrinomonadaceae bacterium]|nr:S8 family serine peptidase [Pyrinomonadaceae bacterium]
MKKLFLLLTAAAVCAFLAGRFASPSNAQSGQDDPQSTRAAKFSELREKVQAKGSTRVIVRLNADFRPEGLLDHAAKDEQRTKIKAKASEFITGHAEIDAAKVKKFKYLPFVAVEADQAALDKLQNDPEVLSVEEDELAKPQLAESTRLVGAQDAWARGFSGVGQTVAVLDTGVDKTHPFLAGKVVAEGCFSTNSTTAASLCPGGATSSTATDSGLNCPAAVDGCSHGTHVAGIVAGHGANFNGVAKDSNLIAIQVFSRFDAATDCDPDPAPCSLSYSSDQIRALERVYELSSTMSIAAVNMSLGGGQYSSNCDAQKSAFKAAVDNLRSRNIATVVSSGNDGYTSSLSAPACISTVVSVGSTDDGGNGTTADNIDSYSNSAPFLSILAPGKWITSSVPGGGFGTWSGTSMAAPHVAAAFAVLKQSKPDATVTQMLNAMTRSGVPLTDSRNGITKPRLSVNNAITTLASPPKAARFDYDGDGKADLSVFRPSTNLWYLLRTSAGYTAMEFGTSGDKLAPADYDGDGKTDIAVFRPSSGTWYIFASSAQSFLTVNWGQAGDVPVPADYDGDGKADVAVFRAGNGTWYKKLSADSAISISQFGVAGDKPQIGDFDGDGKADLAVVRPSDNVWYFLRTASGFTAQQWGVPGDIPAAADYDGDGRTDVAVFRPSTGQWFRVMSTNGFVQSNWGQAGDVPVAADYDGDGKADLAVFRSSNATWYISESAAGISVVPFGIGADIAVENAFAF